MPVTKQFTLGKQERLKGRKAIEQLFEGGERFLATPFRVHYRWCDEKKNALHFGVGVSARNFKKAVQRNRIKRLVREAWRLQKIPLQQKLKEQNRCLHVFFIYTATEMPMYKLIYEKTGAVIDKLEKITGNKK